MPKKGRKRKRLFTVPRTRKNVNKFPPVKRIDKKYHAEEEEEESITVTGELVDDTTNGRPPDQKAFKVINKGHTNESFLKNSTPSKIVYVTPKRLLDNETSVVAKRKKLGNVASSCNFERIAPTSYCPPNILAQTVNYPTVSKCEENGTIVINVTQPSVRTISSSNPLIIQANSNNVVHFPSSVGTASGITHFGKINGGQFDEEREVQLHIEEDETASFSDHLSILDEIESGDVSQLPSNKTYTSSNVSPITLISESSPLVPNNVSISGPQISSPQRILRIFPETTKNDINKQTIARTPISHASSTSFGSYINSFSNEAQTKQPQVQTSNFILATSANSCKSSMQKFSVTGKSGDPISLPNLVLKPGTDFKIVTTRLVTSANAVSSSFSNVLTQSPNIANNQPISHLSNSITAPTSDKETTKFQTVSFVRPGFSSSVSSIGTHTETTGARQQYKLSQPKIVMKIPKPNIPQVVTSSEPLNNSVPVSHVGVELMAPSNISSTRMPVLQTAATPCKFITTTSQAVPTATSIKNSLPQCLVSSTASVYAVPKSTVPSSSATAMQCPIKFPIKNVQSSTPIEAKLIVPTSCTTTLVVNKSFSSSNGIPPAPIKINLKSIQIGNKLSMSDAKTPEITTSESSSCEFDISHIKNPLANHINESNNYASVPSTDGETITFHSSSENLKPEVDKTDIMNATTVIPDGSDLYSGLTVLEEENTDTEDCLEICYDHNDENCSDRLEDHVIPKSSLRELRMKMEEDQESSDFDLRSLQRRRRIAFTPIQYRLLQTTFEHNNFPEPVEQRSIAHQLGAPYRSIKMWFQNKRAAVRKRLGPDAPRAGGQWRIVLLFFLH